MSRTVGKPWRRFVLRRTSRTSRSTVDSGAARKRARCALARATARRRTWNPGPNAGRNRPGTAARIAGRTLNLYVETSAVLSWLLEEGRRNASRRALAQADRIFTSDLTLIECDRVLHRAAATGRLDEATAGEIRTAAGTASAYWTLCAIDVEIVESARRRFPHEPVRSLDAIRWPPLSSCAAWLRTHAFSRSMNEYAATRLHLASTLYRRRWPCNRYPALPIMRVSMRGPRTPPLHPAQPLYHPAESPWYPATLQ